jgi:hypothetical protein
MGFAPNEYSNAHRTNKDIAFHDIADNSAICIGIRKLMSQRDDWRGYPEALHAAIRPYISTKDCLEQIPNASWLARRLPMFIPVLEKLYGIEIVMHKRLDQNGNSNGIIIGVPRGTHFLASPEASGEEGNLT